MSNTTQTASARKTLTATRRSARRGRIVYRIKITHINHLTGQLSERLLQRHYPAYQQAAQIAQRLSFQRTLNDRAVIAQCIATVIPQGIQHVD